MKLKRILCRWKGHDLPHYAFDDQCQRCGEILSYDEMVSNGVWGSIRDWFRPKLRWFRKCEDCGKRFGRHDDSIEHIPF